MIKLAVPLLFLAVAYALFFGYLAETYSALPAKVASHFDVHGHPDGWMSRAADTEILTAVALLVPAIVIGGMGGAGRIPVSFINRPHRDYWEDGGRRKAALGVLMRYAIWFAALNVLFLTGAQALIVEANVNAPHNLDMSRLTSGVIVYLVFTAVWTLLLLRRFSKV
ncbi:MAG TPA: DUF1648 domain-containing protein [Candidatus Methylacidiphilales bacterium]|jgi:uncharacterized membrane protein|nr:DUF1648 domain-containing protein [Candidatus Methylacidiphilales bacterium]